MTRTHPVSILLFLSALLSVSAASGARAAGGDDGVRLGADIYDAGASHRVGIGTTQPAATLDVAGTARLALNAAAPAACSDGRHGTLALTHTAHLCVCNTGGQWTDLGSGRRCAW